MLSRLSSTGINRSLGVFERSFLVSLIVFCFFLVEERGGERGEGTVV